MIAGPALAGSQPIARAALPLRGRLLLPKDAEFDGARRLFNGRFDRFPAAIARCANAEDVQRCIEYARRHALSVSVRSGGHDAAGHSVNDGDLVIDLRAMNAIAVQPGGRSATVELGANVGGLYRALGRHRLTTTAGSCPSVGLGGLILNGGLGGLSAKYGPACDNVLGARIVTADGSLLTVDARTHADLFWAIRGGGGNFGVVTEVRMRAFAISQMLAGEVAYSIDRGVEVLRRYRDLLNAAPPELTTTALLYTDGRESELIIEVHYTGDPARGERELAGLLALDRPLRRSLRLLPPAQALLGEAEPFGTPSMQTGAFLPALTDAAIDAVVERVRAATTTAEIGFDDLRGAAIGGDSAFPLHRRGHSAWIQASWARAQERDAATTWVEATLRALTPFSDGVYVNRLHDEGDRRAREAYGESYRRLAEAKAAYDPSNFFHRNQNILPPKESATRAKGPSLAPAEAR